MLFIIVSISNACAMAEDNIDQVKLWRIPQTTSVRRERVMVVTTTRPRVVNNSFVGASTSQHRPSGFRRSLRHMMQQNLKFLKPLLTLKPRRKSLLISMPHQIVTYESRLAPPYFIITQFMLLGMSSMERDIYFLL